jgi:hypothetical protein
MFSMHAPEVCVVCTIRMLVQQRRATDTQGDAGLEALTLHILPCTPEHSNSAQRQHIARRGGGLHTVSSVHKSSGGEEVAVPSCAHSVQVASVSLGWEGTVSLTASKGHILLSSRRHA